MKMMRWGLALFAVGALSVGSTFASDGGPLVDALVKKGVLSSQEGEEVRMELQEAYMSTGGGMLKWGNSSVRGVKIYGDVRVRYQWENRETFNGNDNERGRFRYRLRVGAEHQFTDNFRAGFRLETGDGADSTNVTNDSFLDANSGDDLIAPGLWYLIYESDDIFESGLVDHVEWGVGKFKQPFMIGKDLWDGDINPEGLYTELGWDDLGPLDMILRGGVFYLDGDFQVADGTGTDEAHDFLFAVQTEFNYSWAKKQGVKFAPSFWLSTGGDAEDGVAITNSAVGGFDTHEDFGVFILPVEAKFKALGYGHKIHAKYGINVLADDGDTNGGDGPFGTNNQLFTAGYQLGKAKKKGTWQIGADYRYIESSAWSSRLVDSDFFASTGVNTHGVVLGGKYAFTDFLVGGVKYYKTWDITEPSGGRDSVDLVQVDLNWKF